MLPLPVLQQAQRDLLALPGVGSSILEISHRSKAFIAILEDAKQALKTLLGIPEGYSIIFLQGGSRLQFSMVPMNLLRGTDKPADYVITGTWGNKARDEAQREGTARIAWDGKANNYNCLPTHDQLDLDPQAAYVHFTSNETIQGVQFADEPTVGDVPLICDASSDILSRPLPIERYGLIYACAQKNAGPAGVTVLIIRDDLLQRSDSELPGYLNYKSHAEQNSLYNTPPTFGVYIVGLVAHWLQEEMGGLAGIYQRNRTKAQLLYDAIDQSDGFYRGHAQAESRSLMNVTFRLDDEKLEKAFLEEAAQLGLTDLKGHRSVGGFRASIYNAMPLAGVEALRDHMCDFIARHG